MSRHWLPRQGSPDGVADRTAQYLIRLLAHLPVYIAIVTTLTFIVVLWRY